VLRRHYLPKLLQFLLLSSCCLVDAPGINQGGRHPQTVLKTPAPRRLWQSCSSSAPTGGTNLPPPPLQLHLPRIGRVPRRPWNQLLRPRPGEAQTDTVTQWRSDNHSLKAANAV
jgi:hypothetical protein